MRTNFPTPLSGHLFRLDFCGNELLQSSVVEFDLDMVNKTINVTFRESSDCEVYPLIEKMIEKPGFAMTWEAMLGRTGISSRTVFFMGLKVIAHNFAMAYDNHSYAAHKLSFSYETSSGEC